MVSHIANVLSKTDTQESKTALIYNNESYSYAELAEQVSDFIGTIIDHTITGDRVLILSGNTPKTIIVFFACLATERIPVIVDPTTSDKKLDYIKSDCQPSLVVTETGEEWVEANDIQFIDIPNLILYTSGSTGEPKGVVCHNSSMCAAVNAINEYLPLTEEDVILNALPFNHSYGLYQMLTIFDAGGTLVLMKKQAWTFPMTILKRIKEHNVTILPVAPTSVALLLKLQEDKIKDRMKSLRVITTAGANFPEHHCEKLQGILPHVDIIPMYGATECVRISYRPAGSNKPGSCGIDIPNQTTKIIDEEGNEVPTGQIGQLIVKGPHLMSYYLNNPEQTAKTFRDGWLYTGDMFSRDEDGFLYFASRNDDVIKIKGEKVSSIELESKLNTIPGIEQAIITAAPNDLVGNVLVYHVIRIGTIRDSISSQQILSILKSDLRFPVDYLPKRIIFWKEFPLVEGTNKIDRKTLREAGINDLYYNRDYRL